MRILYIDIDSLRADHLGCYGYHRNTSPVIDQIAEEGVRFENIYTSDTPCLPSRTALWSGRHGIHTGVMDHVGTAAEPFADGPQRQWHSIIAETNWMTVLRRMGYRTVTVSSFADRHAAFWWYAGYSEVYNTGDTYHGGTDMAEDATTITLDWLKRRGQEDNWFLHVNYWDVHWPYRTPASFGEPFADEPLPDWLTEELHQQHWNNYGPKSAQDLGYRIREHWEKHYPRQPVEIASMADVCKMFDGYDTSILYVDQHIGRIVDTLADLDILDDTAIIIGADHGENLGELNMYMSHRIADHPVTHLPLIIRWPGYTEAHSGSDSAFHYHFDLAATVIDLLGGQIPENWDACSFADTVKQDTAHGRDYLILSAGVGGLSRAVRFEDYLFLRIYHDGYNGLPEKLLFDVVNDPHELSDLSSQYSEKVAQASVMLEDWHTRMMKTSRHGIDPLWQVLREGGPQDMRGQLPRYLERLRNTRREHWATLLQERYPNEC